MEVNRILKRVNGLGLGMFCLAILLLFGVVGVYAAAGFSGDVLAAEQPQQEKRNRNTAYRWVGGQDLVLTPLRRSAPANCLVQPDEGQERDFTVPEEGARYTPVEAWFDGPATITCTESVKVRAGADASFYELAFSAAFRYGGPVMVLVPVVVGVVFGIRRQPS
ncbi:MAG TPA: hypothetical protein VIL00_04140 [Pseudonocardiaceae bacterium]